MGNTIHDIKDEIYHKKREESLTAQSFLIALKENLDPDIAFKIAVAAFTNYMTSIYENVLNSTERGSQERFNRFREFYEEYATKTPYLEIIKSTLTTLKVKYTRCPFFEVSKDLGLDDLAYAFCLSDSAFTKNVLPSVQFSRKHVIAKGDPYCDHVWEFSRENNNSLLDTKEDSD